MGSVLRTVLPIAASFLLPGIGTAIGSALGATGVGASALGSGLLGAGLGAVSGGGLKGALLGGGLGALGGYVGSGGSVPGFGNVAGSSLDQVTGVAGLQGPTQGSGLLGSLTQAAGGAQPMKLGSLLQTGGDTLSYLQGDRDLEKMRQIMEAQAGRAEAQYQPYSQAGQTALANMQAPSMEALQNDPGYQFRLQQGNQALDRSLAARGLSQSGAALKAAQEYGQGLADQTYNDYFNRQGQIANLGYGAAGGLGSIYSGLGNAQAAAIRAEIENRNKFYSSMGNTLGGLFGSSQPVFS